ncbi:MAG: diguanylate cyclase [Syntrophales bacterium]|nr:diguanylate cyclase [Syntrophales bacterium]
MKPSLWTVHLADRLFSREPKRRIRSTQTAVAILITLSGLIVMQYIAWSGCASWSAVIPWTIISTSGYIGFFLAIRSGWSERFADPSLTVAQMIYAVACCASAYAIAGALRGTAFPLAMVIMMFGMFSLKPRQVLAISIYAVALFGVVMWFMSRWRPEVFDPVIEWGHFLMIATMLPTVSVLAGQLSRLRARLQRQKRDLADAVEQIQFLATRDELTGLINRRRMNELLETELQRSMRSGAGFCVAMIDLDHFKRINDGYGHGAGDEALRAFSLEGRRLVRATDSLGRWGGEEFLLLMPNSALPLAQEGVERLRQAMERLVVFSGEPLLRLTLSAGVVQYIIGESVVGMIERADAALYRAKSQGRNRIVTG